MVICSKTVTFEVGTAGADSPWSSNGVSAKKALDLSSQVPLILVFNSTVKRFKLTKNNWEKVWSFAQKQLPLRWANSEGFTPLSTRCQKCEYKNGATFTSHAIQPNEQYYKQSQYVPLITFQSPSHSHSQGSPLP